MLAGYSTIRRLSEINPDVAFISSAALSMDGTVSDYDEAQTEVRRVVIKNAHKAIFIFDSTKLDKTESINLCTLSESDTVIIPRGNCFSVHTEN